MHIYMILTMGNCQDALRFLDMVPEEPHKAIDRRKNLTNAMQCSTATMPISSWSLAREHSDKLNITLTRDEEQPSSSMPFQSLQRTMVRPRLSQESSLRLEYADEEELGSIRYEYSCLEDGIAAAKMSHRPILCIEAYLPGNVALGREVLSHPLLVEAAETLFLPVQRRKTYGPVNIGGQISYTTVRILNESGVDIVEPILEPSLSVATVTSAMIDALNAYHEQVPTYLALLNEELSGNQWGGPVHYQQRANRQAVFGVKCPNRAEVEFAGLNGVVATRAGFYRGRHCVQVTYDTSRLSYCSLVRYALQRGLVDLQFYQSNEERIVGIIERQRLHVVDTELIQFDPRAMTRSIDPKHSLRTTMLRFVPLTDLQSTRANRLISLGEFHEAMHLLSPRQGQIMMRACCKSNSRNEAVDLDITTAWRSISANSIPVHGSFPQ